MIKNIIFDFDGTIADTTSLIVATMRAAMEELGLPVKTEAECKAMIGMRLEDMPPYLWPGLEVDTGLFIDTYRKIFEALKPVHKVKCFPAVKECVERLYESGAGLAIATSRNVASLKNFLRDLGLENRFSMLVGCDEVKNGKPSPEPVQKILDEKGWKSSETLVVGDMPVDIAMGRAAGCKTFGVTYGNAGREELKSAGADHVDDTFSGIMDLVG